MRSQTQKKLKFSTLAVSFVTNLPISGVASAISEIESTSKEINCAEHEYMNMSPSLIALVTLLHSIVVLASQ